MPRHAQCNPLPSLRRATFLQTTAETMLQHLAHLSIVLVALLLGACAATVSKPAGQAPVQISRPATSVNLLITGAPAIRGSSDWQTFRAEWRTAFAAAASIRGINSAYSEAELPDYPPGTVLVKVVVNDYRYLTSGARYGFGIMTGNAFIDADAQYIEFPGPRAFGARKFATSSSAWQGVFSAMTDKQVRAISDEILADLAASDIRASPASVPISLGGTSQRLPSATAAQETKRQPQAAFGQDGFKVEQLGRSEGCDRSAMAVLTEKGPGYETYRYACTASATWTARCEFGNCTFATK